MKFTYNGYAEMIELISKKSYLIVDYNNWDQYDKCVILRHDIDIDLQKALQLAVLEYQLGIKSTYFVMTTSNFYNFNSCRNRKILKEMQNMGHYIGLHFDQTAYPDDMHDVDKIKLNIQAELNILSAVLDTHVEVFSYHRPIKEILDADIMIRGTVNSYSKVFFKHFKYLSDSRMHWREPILDIINEEKYSYLHILTHPFWYQNEEMSMKRIISRFVNEARIERYNNFDENFTDLRSLMTWNEMMNEVGDRL